MSQAHDSHQPALSPIAFGPSRLVEAVPWLMLASAGRFVVYLGGPLALPAQMVANTALLLAFVIVVWRMVLFSDGRSALGTQPFGQQVALARRVLLPILGLLVAAALIAGSTGLFERPGEFLLGFDGIAFDQSTHHGRVWSAFVAAILLLMILQADEQARPSLLRALGQFGCHARSLVPATLAVSALSVLLHPIQSWIRYLVYLLWLQDTVPVLVKQMSYFAFVFLFATLRLWLTVSILVLALRQSYRGGTGGLRPAPHG